MLNRLYWLVPNPEPAIDNFAVYQTTREFYREVEVREEFEAYCQWYEQVSLEHQRDLQKMRREANFFSFFRRRSSGTF